MSGGTGSGDGHRGGPVSAGQVTLPDAREGMAAFGASVVSLATGYLVLFSSDMSGLLAAFLLGGGVMLFVAGARHAAVVQRHFDEGGHVGAGARVLMWALGMVAGAGSLGAVLVGGAWLLGSGG